jgi:hypothetical protein
MRPRETRREVTSESTTPDQVLRAWRPPGTYPGERRWAGVVLMPIVPLPLLLPVAHDRVEFRFRGGTLVDARVWTVEGRVALCGLAVGPCSSPGCYVGR